ncbi:antibiotic biosynthesis monooxygenase family protein [Rhizorhapis sp.]|uniref:antibiotic biosynthesis monooxygenase family protein n=1 Tax=Rhizorhapis sp. TaxID=1968842 RepID=UPI002B47219E|nr:antibiotic biosynthesis monooxygenase [Rhizorhapis sp.]HKR16921.1 antibiotic biosynthesis monooxygenase [Rhizorhapis sp.]
MFVAVYWWRVHPGKEEQFREAWRRGTRAITRIYGSYGSRLHQNADGRFVGYAEWPDEATWRAAYERKMVYDDPEARAMFIDAVAEAPPNHEPVFTMAVTDDLLLRGEDAERL